MPDLVFIRIILQRQNLRNYSITNPMLVYFKFLAADTKWGETHEISLTTFSVTFLLEMHYFWLFILACTEIL